jgi:predicted metal-dependent peptidase
MNKKENERKLACAKLLLSRHLTFFSCLLLHLSIKIEKKNQAFWVSNKTLSIAPSYLSITSVNQLESMLAHAVLHLALQHPQRQKSRQQLLWNIACDIVVNNILLDFSIEPPVKTATNPAYKDFIAEEIYNRLLVQQLNNGNAFLDNIMDLPFKTEGCSNNHVSDSEDSYNSKTNSESITKKGKSLVSENKPYQNKEHSRYWQSALETVEITSEINCKTDGKGIGSTSTGLRREIKLGKYGSVPWQHLLANFVIQSQEDYEELDTRLISLGYYSEILESKKLQTFILVDTSSSISKKELSLFVTELTSIVRLFPRIEIQLFYCDTKIYGPYTTESILCTPKPIGGGGTSFESFVKYVNKQNLNDGYSPRMIIFTDGYVHVPDSLQSETLIWVLTATGISGHKLPFGKIVRLPLVN